MRTGFTKKDIAVGLGCVVFVVMSLGAIGSTGRRRAKEAVCLSNLHKWGVVWKMFLEDRGGRTPEHMGWWGPMWSYYKEEKLLLCPEAARPRLESYLEPGYSARGAKFNAWADWVDQSYWEEGEPPPGKHYLGSYGFNYWFTQDTGSVRDWDELWGYYPGSLFAVKGADRVPILLDCIASGNCPLPTDTPPAFDGDYYPGGSNRDEIRNFCINRHGAAVNGLFLDFSARKVGLKELWLLRWHRKWMQDLEMAGWPTAWENPDHWMHKFKDYNPFR